MLRVKEFLNETRNNDHREDNTLGTYQCNLLKQLGPFVDVIMVTVVHVLFSNCDWM